MDDYMTGAMLILGDWWARLTSVPLRVLARIGWPRWGCVTVAEPADLTAE